MHTPGKKQPEDPFAVAEDAEEEAVEEEEKKEDLFDVFKSSAKKGFADFPVKEKCAKARNQPLAKNFQQNASIRLSTEPPLGLDFRRKLS